MRDRLRQHFPTVAALVAVLLLAATVSLLVGTPYGLAYTGGAVVPRVPLDLPPPGLDADLDSYADGEDLVDGNLLLAVDLVSLDAGDAHPYVLVGTQDDHGRTGAGAELEWPHIVDHDPLGRRAGSPAWQDDAIRTGTWIASVPGDGLARAVAETGVLDADPPAGAAWPQTILIDVRDDRAKVGVDVELWDARGSPDRLLLSWHLETVAELDGMWRADGADIPVPFGTEQELDADFGEVKLRLTLRRVLDLQAATKQELADAWAPTLRFAAGERFFPVPGSALQRFHGFYSQEPDLRTWDLRFNNGRDTYRLLLADFNGDLVVDHADAAVITDLVATGDVGRPTVHAHVALAGDGQVVVQYWFLYFYDFVLGEDDRGIAALAHSGDRELVQLTFPDLEAARNGTPSSAVFGHHYSGVRLTDPGELGIAGAGWPLFIARGSHATYPAPGDDHRVRAALAGYADVFHGDGVEWEPGNYTVEVLGNQPWHAGALWGPMTRYSRDLGTSTRPLLSHDFRYPFSDPLFWEAGMPELTAAEALELYEALP